MAKVPRSHPQDGEIKTRMVSSGDRAIRFTSSTAGGVLVGGSALAASGALGPIIVAGAVVGGLVGLGVAALAERTPSASKDS